MKYPDGQLVQLGDRVSIGKDREAVVVCSIDTGEYAGEHSEAQWGYLKRGVMIDSPLYGLMHLESPDPDLQLIARAPGRTDWRRRPIIGSEDLTGAKEVLERLDEAVNSQIRDALQMAVAKIAGNWLEALRPWTPEVSLALTALNETCRAALHLDKQTTRDLGDAGASLDFDPYVR